METVKITGAGALQRRQLLIGQRIGPQHGPARPKQHNLPNLGTAVVAR